MRRPRQGAQIKHRKRKALISLMKNEKFLGGIFLIVVIAICYWLYGVINQWIENPNQQLSQIVLKGERNFTTDEDIKSLLVENQVLRPYFEQDVNEVQQEVLQLSWIKSVSVKKQFPSTLIIEVSEYLPKYHWLDVFFLDEKGNVFTLPEDRLSGSDDLVRLYGPEGKEKKIVSDYLLLEGILNQYQDDNLQYKIVTVAVDKRNSWQLIVELCSDTCFDSKKIQVILGSEHLTERFNRFLTYFPEVSKKIELTEEIIKVDLRNDNGVIIKKQKIQQL